MKKLTYEQAGVNIQQADALVDEIKRLAQPTDRQELLSGVGGFGALFELPLNRYQKPVLVSGTDGVGTKLKLAIEWKKHDTIGIDLVAMCVNDVICSGAEPLFFLDYYATGQLNNAQAKTIIQGIARGCKIAGCALAGGEVAEMPGLYQKQDYDLAGFCVGVVEKERILSKNRVKPSDKLIALASSGLHANGYSLVRKIIQCHQPDLNQHLNQKKLGELLLTPTRIYAPTIQALLADREIHAIAHITGGGILGNLLRVVPADLTIHLDYSSWKWPPIFHWLQDQGLVDHDEMYRTFNCGVGMILCVGKHQVEKTLNRANHCGETAWVIGDLDEKTST